MKSTALLSLHDRLVARVLDRLRDPALFAVRVAHGWLFCMTGFGKLGNLDGTAQFFAGLGLPAPFLNALFVGLLEGLGGVLLMAGGASRLVAALLFGNMAVAYLTAHRDAFASLHAFTTAAPYPFLLAALLVLVFGPGRWSLDALLRRTPAASTSSAVRALRAEV